MGQLLAETCRLRLLTGVDEVFEQFGFQHCAGVDEAGRGALAGPVVAAAVIVNPQTVVPGVDDSKALSSQERSSLAERIKSAALSWAAVPVDASDIDRINILQATRRAMRLALDRLDTQPDCALVDAVSLDMGYPSFGFVRGDQLSYSVASASIVAKQHRDDLMVKLGEVYPQYGFQNHKGYGAAEHLDALRQFGPCSEHRLTFRSVIPRKGEEVH